jgi:synaptobrevin family protein YKT6
MASTTRVYSLILFSMKSGKPVMVSEAMDLSHWGFFSRGTVKEFMRFASRELSNRVQVGAHECLSYEPDNLDMKFHAHCAHNNNQFSAVVLTDDQYNPRVALGMLKRAFDEAEALGARAHPAQDQNVSCGLDKIVKDFQTPENVDNIARIESDLDETKEILVKGIDALLERGEKLEDLAAQADDLSFASKAFAKQSSDLNRCCTIV